MKRLIAGITLIGLSCVVVLAQQKEKPSSTLPTRPADEVPAPAQPRDLSFELSKPQFPFRQPRANDLLKSPSTDSKQDGPFVFLDGAFYMRVSGNQFLMPVPGGGASGCFSLDLPQRIKNVKELISKLDSLELNRPTPH